MKRLVVLASGSGTNQQAILDASADGRLDATVVHVVADRADAYALERASTAGVAVTHLPRRDGEARAEYDARLADFVGERRPNLVVLAGWMRLLTMKFLGRFPNQVVNLHPARPGELPGTDAVGRAFAEFQRGERTTTGVMVHLVPDEGVDDGPVLATADVPITVGDTLDTLTARVHHTEHRLLVDTLVTLCSTPSPARTDSSTELRHA